MTRNGSTVRPRRFIRDSTSSSEGRPHLHMVKCPFCREHVGSERLFRHHLWLDCLEAPREVNTDVSDWRDELPEFEDEEETERSVSERYADEDTPGEVLPV